MDDETTLDFKDFLQIIKKRIVIILAITLLSAVISGVLSFYVIKPTYEADVKVVIGRDKDGQMDKTLTDSDVLMFQQLMKTYAEIAKSTTVAEDSASKAGENVTGDYVSKHLTVTPQENTQILDIKIKSHDAKEAYEITNSVSDSFISTALKFTPGANIQLLDKPKMPTIPVKPNKILNIVIAFFVGLMASMGLVFAIEYMDDTIKTEQDVIKYLDLPVIAIIPK